MPKFIVILTLLLLYTHIIVKAQTSDYEVHFSLDTVNKTIDVTTDINLPEFWQNKDTVWVRIGMLQSLGPGIRYKNFNQSYTAYNGTSLHFKGSNNFASLVNITAQSGGIDAKVHFDTENVSYIAITDLKSDRITIKTTIKLPSLLLGYGYTKENNYFLRGFYPILADVINDQVVKYEPLFCANELPLPYSLSLSSELPGNPVLYSPHLRHNKLELKHQRVREFCALIEYNSNYTLIKSTTSDPIEIQFLVDKKKQKRIEAIENFFENKDFQGWLKNLVTYQNGYNNQKILIIESEACDENFISDGMASWHSCDKSSVEGIWSIISTSFAVHAFHTVPHHDTWLNDFIGQYLAVKTSNPSIHGLEKELTRFQYISKPKVTSRRLWNMSNTISDFNSELKSEVELILEKSINFGMVSAIFDKNDEIAKTLTPPLKRNEWISYKSLTQNLPPNNTVSHIFENFKNVNKADYFIYNVNFNPQETQVEYQNTSKHNYPLLLDIKGYKGKRWLQIENGANSNGIVTVALPKDSIKSININAYDVLPEEDYENNVWHTRSWKLAQNNMVLPLVLWNNNDGVYTGFYFQNRKNFFMPNKLGFYIAPAYAFGSKSIVGQGKVHYFDQKKVGSIWYYELSLRSFHKDRNTKYDFSERYVAIKPEISYYFNKFKNTKLTWKTYFINEEAAQFEFTNYLGKTISWSYIPQLEYIMTRDKLLSDYKIQLTLEGQAYNSFGNKSYVKAMFSYTHAWQYKKFAFINFRVFASRFLHNTERRSNSYQNIFTRGSIAMIQQGFNDYIFDDYFFSRENQFGLYDNQISMHTGGGFKTAIGNHTNFGLSNHQALSCNMSIDFPYHYIPIAAYFDWGTYATPIENGFVNNVMYNGGFVLKISKALHVYFPIIYSKELAQYHKIQHPNYRGRISFMVNAREIKKAYNTKNWHFF